MGLYVLVQLTDYLPTLIYSELVLHRHFLLLIDTAVGCLMSLDPKSQNFLLPSYFPDSFAPISGTRYVYTLPVLSADVPRSCFAVETGICRSFLMVGLVIALIMLKMMRMARFDGRRVH